jgi:hypothetical protein
MAVLTFLTGTGMRRSDAIVARRPLGAVFMKVTSAVAASAYVGCRGGKGKATEYNQHRLYRSLGYDQL